MRDCLVGLAILVLLYGFYEVALVPWIEPAHARHVPAHVRDDATATPLLPAEIAELFPEGSWERQSPRVLSTSGGIVLFQTNESRADGRMWIRPCTLILQSPRATSKDRPVIVRAPAGASLRFDRPLQLTQTSPGKFLGGQLEGEVTIERPESRPGAGDGFRAQTRSIQLSPNRIWTSQAVEFQFGRHYGSGRELILSLATLPDSNRSMALGRPSELELIHVDQIVLEIPPRKANPQRSGRSEPSTLRLTCDGSFVFDFSSRTAALQRTVRGVHVTPSGVIDQMTAQKLEIGFLERGVVVSTGEDESAAGGMLLHHVKLTGNPARVDAPSQQLYAEATTIHVGYFESRLRLEDPTTSRLRFQQHALSAARILYSMVPGEPKRLGRFEATGPGEYRQHRGSEEMIVRWKGLVTLQPYGREHVLSAPEGATITLGNRASFRSEEVYIWLEEVSAEDAMVAVADRPPAGLETVASDEAPRFRVRPRKLRASGGVSYAFSGLAGAAELLECWFEEEPEDTSDTTVSGNAEQVDGPTGKNASPRSPLSLAGGSDRTRQYRVSAETIRLQWLRRGKEWEISQGQLIGQVVLKEEPNGLLQGDTVELLRDEQGLARFEVVGQPAVVTQNGVILKGETIHVDQAIGRMWMDGAGEMQIPVSVREADATSLPVTMRWQEGMDFDGHKAVFQRAVSIVGRRSHAGKPQVSEFAVEGGAMEATVEPPIDFRKPPRRSQTQLQRVLFPGPVAMRHEMRGPGDSLQSREVLHVQDLEIDYPSGDFRSRHPGWGESVRVGSTLKGAAVSPGAPRPGGSDLIYIRVDFQQAMSGNYQQRRVHFRDRVRAIVGPVASWDGRLDPTRPDRLGPQAFLLNCNELTVLQAAGVQPPSVELHATGSVRVDGRQFAATGNRLVYDQFKDVLLLQGQGRVPARIRFRSAAGGGASQVAAGSIRYSPRSGQLLSTDIQGGQFVAPPK